MCSARRIDPFDGGPHFEANVANLTLVGRYRTVKLTDEDFEQEGEDLLVAWFEWRVSR